MLSTIVLTLACMNAVMMEVGEANRLVARVEKKLEEGKPKQAFFLVPEDVEITDRALADRLYLLRAVAQLRYQPPSMAKGTLRTLRTYLKDKPDDAYRAARVAEGIVVVGKGTDEAVKILDDLEKRDLIPDPEAWATLARLREAAGDTAARDRALERCRKIAKRAEVCSGTGKVAMR